MRTIPEAVQTLLKSRQMVGANKPAYRVTIEGAPSTTPPGSGIEIWTAEDLYYINYDESTLMGDYVQMADIDLSGYPNWPPIGDGMTETGQIKPFTGSYDGNGFKITGLTINDSTVFPQYRHAYGLFAVVQSDNETAIKNVDLSGNITLTGKRQDVGMLVGKLYSGNVENCTVGGSISVRTDYYMFMGGLVGYISRYPSGTDDPKLYIKNCTSTVELTYQPTASNIYSNIGGLFGEINSLGTGGEPYKYTIVENCSVEANITTLNTTDTPNKEKVGGIAGFTNGVEFTKTYYKGIIKVPREGGGFFGRGVDVYVNNCYAFATFTLPDGYAAIYSSGWNYYGYGGFAPDLTWDDGGVYLNAYSVATFPTYEYSPDVRNSGFVARDEDIYGFYTVTSCYYNQTITSETDFYGIGKSTSDMKIQDNYTGWDFTTIWAVDGAGIVNEGYPYFRTAADPGLLIPVKSISISRDRTSAASLTLTVDNKAGIYSPDKIGDWYQILYPNVKIEIEQGYGTELIKTFTGWIDRVEVKTFPAEIIITCRDAMKKALDQIVTNTDGGSITRTIKYSNKTPEWIFEDLCTRGGISIGYVQASGMTIKSKKFSWESYADAFQFLCDIACFKVYGTEGGSISFRRDTIPASPTVSYTFSEGEDIISLGYTIDDQDLYNHVRVFGKSGKTTVTAYTYYADRTLYNMPLQKVLKIDSSESDTIAECQEIADRAAALMETRAKILEFAAVAVPWLQVDDFIQVVEMTTNINDVYRITEVSTDMTPDNGYTMNLKCFYYGAIV